MITFGNKVNRCYSLYLPFMGTHVTANAFFHKGNTFLGFTIDHGTMSMVKDGRLTSKVYRDLKQSSFANTFLDIRDYSSPTLDIRCQFSNIRKQYKDRIQYVTNETIKLSKYPNPHNPNKFFESCLYIYVFSFLDYQDDFLYFLAERQHIDQSLGRKLVRTCGLQIATKQCAEDLGDMMSFYHENDNNEFVKTDDALKDLFGKNEVSVRKM